MIKHLIATCTLFVFLVSALSGQSIGIGTTTPESSALLDMSSTEKGILIPRMSSTDRQAISDPALGLMVFDTTTKAFYYFMGSGWLELLAGKVDEISDADGDTKIQTEESANENKIRFDVGGTERLVMDGAQINILNTGESVFLGNGAGAADDHSDNRNVFIGEASGTVNTTGEGNTGIGWHTLKASTTGIQNTAIGYNALLFDTEGYQNTAVGSTSLLNCTTGDRNCALGTSALWKVTTGGNNIGIGYKAGYFLLTGNNNIFLGSNSGEGTANYSTSGNVMIGYKSGQFNSGNNNIFLGLNAGQNETGSNRLFIENSSADQNAALIYGEFDNDLLRINGTLNIKGAYSFPLTDGTADQVLKTNGSGQLSWVNRIPASIQNTNGNTRVETGDDHVTRFYNNGTLGMSLVRNAGNQVLLRLGTGTSLAVGNDAGNDMTNAAEHNTLMGNLAGTKITGTDNTAIGFRALVSGVNISENVAIGSQALAANTAGTQNVAIGAYAGSGSTSGTNNVFIGYSAGSGENGSNRLYIDNSSTGNPLIYGEFDNNKVRINGDFITGGKTKLGDSGNLFSSVITKSISRDVGSIASNGSLLETFTVDGATTVGAVFVSPGEELPGSVFIGQAYVSAANTVTVRFLNEGSASQNPSSMWYRITVINF